jgi:hypothetical protein
VTTDAELTRVDRNGTDVEESTQASAKVQPAPEPQRETIGAITGATPPPEPREPAPAPVTNRADRTDLPRTAGPLPLLALIGLGSLAGSRLARKAR